MMEGSLKSPADRSQRTRDVIPAVFDRHAAAYRDRLAAAAGRGEARGRARVVELLRPRPRDRVLDLGCGPGVLTLPLADAVGERGLVAGVDLSDRMLALAREAAPPQVALARMDMERLGFRDGVFDAVACGHALQFCTDLAAALSESRRVLVSRGRFAASLPASAITGPASRLLDEVFARRLPRPLELADGRGTREAVRDQHHLRAAMDAAGFRLVAIERVDEIASYRDPVELVEQTLRWWSCAWRLEAVSAATREQVRAEALDVLYERVGEGPLELPGATWVLSAIR
jgi:ubiquinone/menaquinone biosynthesis C-methylase UbiE